MGSASQPMLVVKYNRALLRKRRSFKDIREEYEGYLPNTKLAFKKLTEFEKKKIRDKIIEQAKRDRMNEIKLYFISAIVLAILLFAFYFFFTS